MTSKRKTGDYGTRQITMVDAEETGSAAGESSPLLGAGAEHDEDHTNSGDWIGYKDFEDVPRWRRPSVYWLIGPYFLFTLAFGGIIVPKLNLIIDMVCRRYVADQTLIDPAFIFAPVILGGDNPQCNIPVVQRSVATFTLTIGVLTGVLSALTAPKLGNLSDRYGRTRLLTIASCGGVINEIITILAAKYPDVIDYHWLLLGAFFDGLAGSFTAGNILGSSYAADCTPPSKRSVTIGYLHACLFTGLAFGPLLAGYFVKFTESLLSIFYVALGCHLIFIFFLWFVTPESLSKKRQMTAREKHQNEQKALAERVRSRLPGTSGWIGVPVATFLSDSMGEWLPALLSANPLAPLKVLVPSGRQNRQLRRNMIIYACIDTVILSSAMGSGTVTILYVEYTFNWGNFEASRFVSLLSFIRVIVLLGVFPWLNYIFRIRPLRRRQREGGLHVMETNAGADEFDIWMLRVALLSDVAGILGYVFVRTEQLFVVFGAITSLGGLGGAVIQSSITKHVPAERVGSLLGGMGLLHALGRVFSPMIFNGIYAATVESFPQAFFVVLASTFILGLMGSLFVRPHLYLIEDDDKPVQTSGHEPNSMSDEEVVADAEVVGESSALPRT